MWLPASVLDYSPFLVHGCPSLSLLPGFLRECSDHLAMKQNPGVVLQEASPYPLWLSSCQVWIPMSHRALQHHPTVTTVRWCSHSVQLRFCSHSVPVLQVLCHGAVWQFAKASAGVEPDSSANPASVICLHLICTFVWLVCLFIVKKKKVAYFSQYLSSPFIAFYAHFVLFLFYIWLVSTAEDPLLIVTEISFSNAAKSRWGMWAGGL